ncbi:MAG: DUF5686 family protein [Bacteroidota bacterium]|nr:DUF5686 family protein [Bacteroidota bacterium]
MIHYRKYGLLAFCLFACLFLNTSFAQSIRVSGTITDAQTKEILPYVNLHFSGTDVGGISDANGAFYLRSNRMTDSLFVSFIGYETQRIPITSAYMPNLEIELQPSVMKLGEVIIRAGQDPAMILLELIREKREDNKLRFLDHYSYSVYNKLQFDLNNLQGNFGDAALLKPFEFLNDYIDTVEVSGKAYLPFFISETVSERYHSNKSGQELEVIRANNISGINNESLRRYTGDMYQDVNIYDNVISVLGKGFISPIGRMGKSYYNYVLSDTLWQEDRWCYKLEFVPKRKYESTIEGYVYVNDTSFAVKSFRISLSQTASINFVDSLIAEKRFVEIADSVWMISYDNLFIDFNIFESAEGFFGRKTSHYSNHKINQEVDTIIFHEKHPTNLVYKTDSLSDTDDYWNAQRPEDLSERERAIYIMVDTVTEIKAFQQWERIITMLVTGYYVTGLVELGPVFSFISSNPVEGNRLRFGLRTSNEFSRKVLFESYGAYGFGDEKWKYGGGSSYMFNTLPRRALHFHFAHDYMQMGSGLNALRTDNLLGTMLRRPGIIHLHFADQYELLYEHEFVEGFSVFLGLQTERIISPPTSNFYLFQQGDIQRSPRYDLTEQIQNSELVFGLHYAKDEKFIRGSFEQVSLGTKKPIINLRIVYSPEGFLANPHEFIKTLINYKHKLLLYPLGELHYAFEAGKVFGKAYYPFLFVHQGNQSFAFSDFAFNLMNYYEFVSDEYLSFYAEQKFEGFFLNHIPVMRRLQWREHIGFRASFGNLSSENRMLMFYPYFINDFYTESGDPLPYMETNIGISNIFKVLRLDAVWRLSHLKNADIYPFAITAKLHIDF